MNDIEYHNEHAFKLNKKFKDIWYPQGPVPADVRKAIGLEDIKKYLASFGERKTAVLFHGVKGDYLRTWLITYSGKIICVSPRKLQLDEWKVLQPKEWSELGVRGAKHARTAMPIDNTDTDLVGQTQKWKAILQRLSDILLPQGVQMELEASKIDTLVVVPITVREFNPSADINEYSSATNEEKGRSFLNDPSTRAALSIGVVPFAALPIKDDVLISKMSIVIAPGFFSFARPPVPLREKYFNPIVVGNPAHKEFQALPGSGEEARRVAVLLKTNRLFVGKTATKMTVEGYLRQSADTVDFIHLATHGVADAVNPVDESFLVLSDSLWNAREISRLRYKEQPRATGASREDGGLPLLQAKPLVIMSACQTALGKDFPAGTIGLARAWHWAGASNVVMSLWSVDDEATKELMGLFVELLVQGQAVDKALQSAMMQLRDKKEYASPSNWASFGIYGAPEKLVGK